LSFCLLLSLSNSLSAALCLSVFLSISSPFWSLSLHLFLLFSVCSVIALFIWFFDSVYEILFYISPSFSFHNFLLWNLLAFFFCSSFVSLHGCLFLFFLLLSHQCIIGLSVFPYVELSMHYDNLLTGRHVPENKFVNCFPETVDSLFTFTTLIVFNFYNYTHLLISWHSCNKFGVKLIIISTITLLIHIKQSKLISKLVLPNEAFNVLLFHHKWPINKRFDFLAAKKIFMKKKFWLLCRSRRCMSHFKLPSAITFALLTL
jgi:hypothetical protein